MDAINCRFEETDHIYYMDDVPVPSVTGVLKDAGLINTDFFTEWGRSRGSVVHKATEFYDEGDLNEEELDPLVVGYVEAWKKFRREFEFEIHEMEKQMYHPTARFAGTLDRVGLIRGDRAIADIKTGQLTPVVGLQLTGYADLYQAETGNIIQKLFGVQLKENGTYAVKTYILDFAAWRAALTLAHWKREV